MKTTLKTRKDPAWTHFINSKMKFQSDGTVGKWMYFFSDRSRAELLTRQAVEQGVCLVAKCGTAEDGVACFYVDRGDKKTHKKIISYFIQNDMIRKTKSGRFYNISFKLDEQTKNNEYGDDYDSELKLEELIDLETGQWKSR